MPEVQDIELQTKEKPKNLIPYIGIWIKGKSDNSPAILIHPDFLKEELEYLERFYKNQFITGSVQIEDKTLINRTSIKSIKNFAMSVLQKLSIFQNAPASE